MYKKFTLSFLILVTTLFVACTSGTLEVGVEPTSTPITQAITNPTQPSEPQPTHTPVPVETVDIPVISTATPIPTDEPAAPISPYAGIFYRQGDQLFQIGDDGQPIALNAGIDAQILPGQFTPRATISDNGQHMLSWWDWSDLWLVNLSTGETQNLTNTPDQEECCAQFWQEGRVLFLTREANADSPFSYKIATANLDGSDYHFLEDFYTYGTPAISPDGSTIAYNAEGKSWLYTEAGGSQLINPNDYGMAAVQEFGLTNPTWSPTGKYLAWMLSGDPFAENRAQGGAVIFDMQNNIYRWLHPYEPVGSGGGFASPVWSPDGNWLVVFDHSANQPGAWLMHPDGTGETLIYGPSGVRSVLGLQALWSPNAQRLLIIDPNAEGGTNLTFFNTATNSTEASPLPANAIPIAWLP